jgi:hypothetical protein
MTSRLQPLPDSFVATRQVLHRVAEQIVAPARKPDNEIALRQTPGGFGTPPFDFQGSERQVRVDGAELVIAADGAERRSPLTSIADAAAFAGAELFPGGVPKDDSALGIDPVAAERLGDFYALAAGALERLRSGLPASDSASEINLWPEHFDIALEAGDEDAGLRANYGASPGDEDHPEPYFYVGPWTARPEGELWNAAGFAGAELRYGELLAAEDPEAAALDFLTSRRRALAG